MTPSSLFSSAFCIVTLFFLTLSVHARQPLSRWSLDNKPRVQRNNNKSGLVVGSDNDGNSAYRYRNGFDKTNGKGARIYEHNAGYGYAGETVNANPGPEQSIWSRRYATAQSSTWGKKVPRVWLLAADDDAPMSSSAVNSVEINSSSRDKNNKKWTSDDDTVVFGVAAEPAWTKNYNGKRKQPRRPSRSNTSRRRRAYTWQ